MPAMNMPIPAKADALPPSTAKGREPRGGESDTGFAEMMQGATPARERPAAQAEQPRNDRASTRQASASDAGASGQRTHGRGQSDADGGEARKDGARADGGKAAADKAAADKAAASGKGGEASQGSADTSAQARSASKDAELAARLQHVADRTGAKGAEKAAAAKTARAAETQANARTATQAERAAASTVAAGKAGEIQSGKIGPGKSTDALPGQRVSVTIHQDGPVARPGGPLNGATAVAAANAAQQGQDKTAEAASKAANRFVAGAEAEAAAEEAADGKRGRRDAEAPDPRAKATGKTARGDADGTRSEGPRTDAAKPQTRGGLDAAVQSARAADTPAARPDAGGPTTAPMVQTAAGGPSQTFDPVMQQQPGANGPAGQTGGLDASARAAATQAQTRPGAFQPAVDQVAVQVQRAAANGQNRVQIRLNPAELGRIEVKLETRDDGLVRAVLSVDKPETLDLMQRDPRALEKALQDAGLKTDGGSLSFNLRGDGDGAADQGRDDGDADAPSGRRADAAGSAAGDAPAAPGDAARMGAGDGRLDIRV